MKHNYFYLAFLVIIIGGCSSHSSTVPFNSPEINYEGRILFRTDAAELSWPGTSVTINFEGTGVSATLKDLDTANYYNVIVDYNVVSKIHTDTIKQNYVLASGLPKGKHSLQLFKRTEWDKGKTLFYGFELAKHSKLLSPPVAKERKIEFYGNSITCGYALEDSSGGDSGIGYFENNYLTYAALTARYFDAQYVCTSKSGIGVMVSWFPMIMPELYDRLDPTDSASKWDFSQYTPDVVVINLFQNDSWLINMPGYEKFREPFGGKAPDDSFIISAYRNLVASIRSKYPDAFVICSLGSMDATREGSPWPGYVEQAVQSLNDSKIGTCFFQYKNTNGHPNRMEQQVMADSLIAYIHRTIGW